jgi:preprotein translocase subunit SecG
MITVLTILHVIVCVFLILVVLLQQGKGQDLASSFGGGGTQTTFGARSSTTVLHRLTTVAAVMFMFTSMGLTILISQPGAGSVLSDDATVPTTETSEPSVEDAVPADEGADQTPDPDSN